MVSIKNPYLIARGNIAEDKPTIIYDYMGSAEFEFGAIPESWRRLFSESIKFHKVKVVASNGKSFEFLAVARESFEFNKYQPFFQQFYDKSIRLKEWTDFDTAINSALKIAKPKQTIADTWHDIENDVIFSVSNEAEFKETIEHLREHYTTHSK